MEELRNEINSLREEIVKARLDSAEREKRIFTEVQRIGKEMKTIAEKADIAHATALEAKQAANRASVDAEGSDHNIYAELGSLKVSLNETSKRLESTEKQLDKEKEEYRKAKKKWRIIQPTLFAALTVLANQIIAPGSIAKVQQSGPVSIPVIDSGK